MLIRFEVSNYRSISAPAELSMVAIDRDRPEARFQPLLGESLLPIAAIFGANASGKSNLISAYTWLQEAIFSSLREWDDGIPIEPFAFGNNPEKPSEFSVEYMINGVRFEYVLELNSEKVIYEALFHYPEKKRRRVFERDGDDFKLQRGLGTLSGTRELLTDRTLAVSIARRSDEPLVTGFVNKVLRSQTLGLTPHRPRILGGWGTRLGYGRAARQRSTIRYFEEPDQPSLFEGSNDPDLRNTPREQALALLRLADLGIDDVMIDEVAYPDAREPRNQRRVRLVHQTAGARTPLDFAVESEGTRTWFNLIGPVLTALRYGSLLLFDELDASLHPTLSAQLIQLFHDPVTNPLGSQIVFTSHDTSLLNHLNRDEVWLTNKNADGSTTLGALADFAGERVRKSQNLENAYLHGRFGALPQVDQTELLRALGLIG
ncbi:ATP/GTP-binding protein [Umezawaea endophytica]|uniref:ATP-binding protein n=1 Tax=Umezawaea endophytica TaxID=1654476 RepID=A0A9X2VY20_9PSEU|nr:ATP-binding protein [Umezawaea endophytica]MCS7484820.1 ATP-binding protein [Umezawaea endophytica]